MIDGLANRNRAPKGVSLRGSVRKSPLFLENYDWNEQHRVLLAVRRLYEQTSEGLWEELLRNVDDKRYSLTLKDNSELYILCHTTVGSYCHGLAWDHLVRLSERHLPEQANDERGRKIAVPAGIEPDLVEWRKKRPNKTLYELQIEVCENRLKGLSKATGIPKDDINLARKRIEKEIEDLKRTKQPVMLQHPAVTSDDLFSAKEAKWLREQFARPPQRPKK